MAIAHVAQVGTHGAHPVGGSTSATCTLSATPGAGSLLVAAYTGAQFAPTSASDPKGNTWSVARTSADGGRAVLWTLQDVGTLASGDVITFTLAGNNFRYEIMIDEFSGVLATSPVDATASGSFTSGTSRIFQAVTTTTANDLIYAMTGIGAAETSYTAGGSYTALTYFTDGTLSVEGQFLVTATVGSVTPTTATGGATTTGATVTVAFKAATGTLKTITAVGLIASAEAFGTTRLRSPQYISAAGAIQSGQAFGSGDTYGPAFYGTSKYGGGSAASLTASATTRQLIYPTAIPTAQAFGTPVLRVMGTLTTVRPTAIGSAEAFGIPLLGLVDRTSSSYGGISLGDVEVFASASDDTTIYSGTGDDALLVATAIDDLPFGGGEQISDQPQFVCTVDDIPGR